MISVKHLLASFALLLVACGGGGGGSSGSGSGSGVPVVTTDVRVGDINTSYTNLEISPSMKYITWQEPSAAGPSVWIAGLDPDTAALIPADGRGFKVAGTPMESAPQWGVDAQGEFLLTGNQAGQLLLVRPSSGTTASVTVLPLPANTTRQYPYPSRIAARNSAYALYLQKDAQGLPHVWLADLTIPGQERQVTSGPIVNYFPTPNFPPTIYQWFPGLPQFIYGYNAANNKDQVKVVDLSSGIPVTTAATNDNHHHIDDRPAVIDGIQSLVGGVDGTAQGALYRRSASSGQFIPERTFTPVGSQLLNPQSAASFEPFAWNGKSYATFVLLDSGRTPGSYGAEVWLTSLSDGTVLWRVSGSETPFLLDPEVFLGRSKVWVFYYGRRSPNDTTFELRRAELGLP